MFPGDGDGNGTKLNVGRAVFVVIAAWAVHFWMAYRVMLARSMYEVKYPHMYAPEKHPYKHDFDSVQRAHQNTLETIWGVMTLVLVVSAGPYGAYAAPLGLLYLAGRVVYASGYEASGPEGRFNGALISHVGDVPLLFLAGSTAFKWISTVKETRAAVNK